MRRTGSQYGQLAARGGGLVRTTSMLLFREEKTPLSKRPVFWIFVIYSLFVFTFSLVQLASAFTNAAVIENEIPPTLEELEKTGNETLICQFYFCSSAPTSIPTDRPTISPTFFPSRSPVIPTFEPSVSPTLNPTLSPSVNPTGHPTLQPSTSPSVSPSLSPTVS